MSLSNRRPLVDPLPPPPSHGADRRSALRMLAVWMAGVGVVYVGADRYLKHQADALAPRAGADGEWIIPRGRDGHFRVHGSVNSTEVDFLVDTGASLVTISHDLAERAGLRGERPLQLQTANGVIEGRLAERVRVTAAELEVPSLRIAIALQGTPTDFALLGQNFLAFFDIEIRRGEMTLRPLPVR